MPSDTDGTIFGKGMQIYKPIELLTSSTEIKMFFGEILQEFQNREMESYRLRHQIHLGPYVIIIMAKFYQIETKSVVSSSWDNT